MTKKFLIILYHRYLLITIIKEQLLNILTFLVLKKAINNMTFHKYYFKMNGSLSVPFPLRIITLLFNITVGLIILRLEAFEYNR